MRRGIFCILILVLVIVASGWLGGKIPSGFVPTEDQGYLFANLTLPESASLQRTAVATKQVGDILRNTPGVPIPPRAIPGIGTSGGVTFILEDRAGMDVDFLVEQAQRSCRMGRRLSGPWMAINRPPYYEESR